MDLTAHPGTVARRVDHVVRRRPPRCESMRAPYHPVLRPIGYPHEFHVEHRPPRGAALHALGDEEQAACSWQADLLWGGSGECGQSSRPVDHLWFCSTARKTYANAVLV